MTEPERSLSVDILVRGSDASGGSPVRPRTEDIERLRRTLEAAGVGCHATRFGVACSAPRAVLERVLGPAVVSALPGESLPVPPELADLVEQITVPVLPELFTPG